MSCPSYRDSIVLLVDGELSDEAAASVRGHVLGCDDCAAFQTELLKLKEALTPVPGDATPLDEARFWRKFDADLAARVAAAEIPWWKRSIAIPVPGVALALAVVVGTGFVAGRYHRRASEMESRAQRLQAVLRDASESTIFPTVHMPEDLKDLGGSTAPVRTAGLQVAPAAGPRALPASNIQFPPPDALKRSRTSIRFVDSEGVLQPGDLY